jgi:uncharacterized phage protein gp47/JayE
MMNALPDDIDKSELQIPWDFTRPAAIEKAEFVQFELNETIKIIFPHWAEGAWLDLHAEVEGLKRRPSNKASGNLLVTGRAGIVVEKGFQFATPASVTASVIFEATETVIFDGEPDGRGQVTAAVPIQATEGGREGNVPPDTIILMVVPPKDGSITYVTNPEPTTGGVPEESDDDLRERVLEAIRRGISYAGRDADYVRWAKEVPGVGQVVVDPEWDDPSLPEQFHWIDGEGRRRCAGAVRLFIVDGNGVPANEQIIEAVYNYIVSPDDRIERLAPIGATVTVVPPAPVVIDITARVTLKDEERLETVTERFRNNLYQYWITAALEKSVKYVYVGSTLAETAGIANYAHATFFVNGAADDVPITIGQFPVTGEVNIYA